MSQWKNGILVGLVAVTLIILGTISVGRMKHQAINSSSTLRMSKVLNSSILDGNVTYVEFSHRSDWSFMSAHLDHRQYPRAQITIFAVKSEHSLTTYFKCIRLTDKNNDLDLALDVVAEEQHHYDNGRAKGATRALKFSLLHFNKTIYRSTTSLHLKATFASSLSKFTEVTKSYQRHFELHLSYIPPLAELRPKYNFTLCLAPAYGNLPARRYVEFIEMNQILGGEHFYIYDYSASALNPKLRDVWRYYGNIVSVVKWDFPLSYDSPQLYYYLQILALQHCLYRAMLESRYTMFYDLDELLVPASVNTWSELVQQIGFHGNDTRCAVCFPMAYSMRGSGSKSPYFRDVIQTISHSGLSKCLTRPAFVYDMFVHWVKTALNGNPGVTMGANVALIQHYYGHHCSHASNKNSPYCRLSNPPYVNMSKYENDFNRRIRLAEAKLKL